MEKVEFETDGVHVCSGQVLSCEDTGRTIASFWSYEDAEDAVSKINAHDELIEALAHSTERLEAVFKNTGSLGCRAQMEFNQELLAKLKAT